MEIVLNGERRDVNLDSQSATLDALIQSLEMKADRVAVEHNGTIVRREAWAATLIQDGDRFEIVHFVGGGTEGAW